MTTYILKPSVSDLIGQLDKPALLKWANKIGLAGTSLDEYRAKSRSNGISLHKQIAEFVQNKTKFADAAFQKRFVDFFADKQIIAVEKPIEHDMFSGRLDIKFSVGGVIHICDFKSNQSRIYLENKLQLVAYRMATPCAKVGIISIPDMTFLPVNIEDFAPYERCITLLAELFQLRKKL